MTEPAWLLDLIDQRMALIEKDAANLPAEAALILTPVTEPSEGATDEEYQRWDRTCDNCGKDCTRSDFFTGHAVRRLKDGRRVYLTFGVCSTCKFN